MVRNIFSILLIFLVFTTNGQVSQLNGIFNKVAIDSSEGTSNPTSGGSDTTNAVYEVVEIQPSPPGGMAGWNKYLMENLRYPTIAQRKGIEGTVIVAFVVNTDGTTTDIEILRSVGGGCDEEVIRIVKGSPKWTPGMQRGTPVRTRMRLPLRFMLGGTDPSRDSTEVSLNAVPLPPAMDGQDSSQEGAALFFDVVDTPPSPVGGFEAWSRHLSENLTYPTSARMKGIQGTVLVSFIVNTDGTIEGIELVQGIGGGCDEEAIRIIKSSPSWTPGMIKGKAVRTRMKIPISFKLG
jgi:TonB family protein